MPSITIRNLSAESKEQLLKQAESSGCSVEALARSILYQAAHAPVPPTPLPRRHCSDNRVARAQYTHARASNTIDQYDPERR